MCGAEKKLVIGVAAEELKAEDGDASARAGELLFALQCAGMVQKVSWQKRPQLAPGSGPG